MGTVRAFRRRNLKKTAFFSSIALNGDSADDCCSMVQINEPRRSKGGKGLLNRLESLSRQKGESDYLKVGLADGMQFYLGEPVAVDEVAGLCYPYIVSLEDNSGGLLSVYWVDKEGGVVAAQERSVLTFNDLISAAERCLMH